MQNVLERHTIVSANGNKKLEMRLLSVDFAKTNLVYESRYAASIRMETVWQARTLSRCGMAMAFLHTAVAVYHCCESPILTLFRHPRWTTLQKSRKSEIRVQIGATAFRRSARVACALQFSVKLFRQSAGLDINTSRKCVSRKAIIRKCTQTAQFQFIFLLIWFYTSFPFKEASQTAETKANVVKLQLGRKSLSELQLLRAEKHVFSLV